MSFRIIKKNNIKTDSQLKFSPPINSPYLRPPEIIRGSVITPNKNYTNKSFVVGNLQGTKILSDISGQFGWSIDTDNAGQYVVVGAPTAQSSVGYAKIYAITSPVNTASLLYTTSQLSDPSGNYMTGFSVSISGNGNVIAVGAPGYNSNNGGVLIYTNNNGVISYSTIISPTSAGAYIGQYVKLNKDGTVLAIGAPLYGTTVGRVWVYKYTTSWNLVQVISNPDSPTAKYFGDVISMNCNGNKIFIGARSTITGGIFGRVYVANYSTSNSQWSLNSYYTGISVNTTSAIADVEFDFKASLDDNYLVISSSSEDDTIGTASVISLSPSTDISNGQFVLNPLNGEVGFGYKVCISGDAKTIYISSATDDSNEGQIWIYRQSEQDPTTWTRVLEPFRGTGDVGQPQQGFAIACGINGSNLMIGGPFDNLNKGAYWSFI